jgi:type IV secretory pathway VirB2 component (pilin)
LFAVIFIVTCGIGIAFDAELDFDIAETLFGIYRR